MNKGSTLLIIIVSILILILLSAVFIAESIRNKGIKDKADIRFNEIEKWLNEGNFSEYKSKLSVYSNNLPNLLLLIVTDLDNRPVYLYSSTDIDPDNYYDIFLKESSSKYTTLYKGSISINKKIYTLKGIFLTLTEERLYILFKKLVSIIFLYLIFIIALTIYHYELLKTENPSNETINSNPINKKTINGPGRSVHQTEEQEIDHGSDTAADNRSDEQEEYKKQISNELKKAAAFDQDIVLVLVSSPGNSISDNSNKFHDILTRNFPFHDLIFHYSDNTFALLLPNTDLEQGIHQIELFDQIFVSSTESLKFPIMFGLSSRNGRLISGDIIMKEANAALHKAMSESHYPIIGFRPNPARYREYLSKIKTG